MADTPESTPHYSSLHFADTSVFTSLFPLDTEDPVIRDALIEQIPNLADSVLLLNNVVESYETIMPRGAITLAPLSTDIEISQIEDTAHRDIVYARHNALRALTDGHPNTASVRFDREKGEIKDFSLALLGPDLSKNASYELRGVVNREDGEVFELSTFNNGIEVESVPVDRPLVEDLIHAVLEQKVGRETPSMPLDVSLLTLLHDYSNEYSHVQSKQYEVPLPEKNIRLGIERIQRIQKEMSAKTMSLLVTLNEVISHDSLKVERKFEVSYDQDRKPRRTAVLSSVIHNGNIAKTPREKEQMFEGLSVFMRNHPIILLNAIVDALSLLADPDRPRG